MNPILNWALFSRSKFLQNLAVRLINPKQSTFKPSIDSISILNCGDMSFDPAYRMPPGVYRSIAAPLRQRQILKRLWRKICTLIFSSKFVYLRVDIPYAELHYKGNEDKKSKRVSHHYNTRRDLDFDQIPEKSKFSYPFEKISPLLKEKDVVWANLETPLSTSTRSYGFFISDPHYTESIKDAGITMVCLANNHIFDAGEHGFEDTLNNLERVGIPYTGAGKNLDAARSGRSLQINDIKLAFLSYTQYCNVGFASVAATQSGILPLDLELIVDDIQAVKNEVDYTLVSLHWGIINQHSIHRKQIAIAHQLIDSGADAIIGHSPHVPHGIEIYNEKPILYSLGNFIFPYDRLQWTDNFLAEIVVTKKCIEGVAIYPISGKRQLFQPERLQGARADRLLHDLQMKSAVFNTGIGVENHVGYIRIAEMNTGAR